MTKLVAFTLLLSLQTLLMAGYTLTDGKRTPSKIDHLPKGKIADMKNIPQDPAFYAKQLKKVSYKEQLKWDREYNKKYFKPWSLKKIDKPLVEMQWPFRSVTKRTIYNSKGRVIHANIYNQWIRNANFGKLNTAHQRAITTRHVNLRALPTSRPFYRDPKKTGEGFPFDYNQNSSYHMNTPLFVSHYSRDRKWAYVRGSTAYGWIKASKMAVVGNSFVKKFKNNHYSIVVRDNLELHHNQKKITLVKLGTIFPTIEIKTKEKKKVKRYLFATRDKNGRAILQNTRSKQKGLLAKKPIAMTAKNVTLISRQFRDEPYGWGGLLETRDCSSFTKDYFAPFGIFLRRNSRKQARDGRYINIKGIPKNKKKRAIISNAKPFQSMLYVPGHIVLYLGQYKGEPIIMHTYWGARLKDGSKKILARTVITTMEPGKELRSIKERSKLANTLKAIVTPGG